jgi:co-chaperonin GroES (HSP10)
MKQLIGKKVLLDPEDPTITESGIILEATQKNWEEKRPEYGTVLYVGSKVEEESIKPGVRVHFNKMAAKRLDIDGKTCVLLREEDINGVFVD